MAASLRLRTPQVTAQTLAQQAVPGASGPDGEKLSRSAWCSDRNRGTNVLWAGRPKMRIVAG
jgi:hypothetical protein